MMQLVQDIHATPHKLALAVTGGGSGVINELLRYGEGSNTVLEAVVPYATASLDGFLGRKPDKYASLDTARDMSMAAYHRARVLAPDLPLEHVLGVGATCSLVKAGTERAGRKHVVFAAVQCHDRTLALEAELRAARNRMEEEGAASGLILDLIAQAVGLKPYYIPLMRDHTKDLVILGEDTPLSEGVYRVVNGLHNLTSVVINPWASEKPKIIFPGSFNPPHPRHMEIVGIASQMFKAPVDFEITVLNVDKPPALHYAAINRRVAWLTEQGKGNQAVGQVYLTNAPTFVEKVRLFRKYGATERLIFPVGYDTLRRILDPKYCDYDNELHEARLREIWELDARFLVFHRKDEEKPDAGGYDHLCYWVSIEESEDKEGHSSTKLRKENSKE